MSSAGASSGNAGRAGKAARLTETFAGAAPKQRLHEALENHRRTGRLPVREVPALPLSDERAPQRIGREHTAFGSLRREVLQDCIRLPQHETLVFQHRHLAESVQRQELVPFMRARLEIDMDQFMLGPDQAEKEVDAWLKGL